MQSQDIKVLMGLTFSRVYTNEDKSELIFELKHGGQYFFHHCQSCCESVYIEDITGELSDLAGSPITMVQETCNADGPEPEYAESYTWTFYRFASEKGNVEVRWLGQSNGYYGEEVDLHYRPAPKQ